MNATALAGVVALLPGLAMAMLAVPVLHRLPEPADPDDKLPYRELATPWFVLVCTAATVAASAAAWLVLPLRVQPLWAVLALCGVLLAAIDARTTWLPLFLTRVGWVLMALATAMSLLLGGTLGDVLRTVVGSLAAGAFYLLVWSLTGGGFGFGDVRYAPLLGAATAGASWTLLVWGLVVATAVGGLHGGVRLLGRRPGGFPYAPSMLLGTYLAAVLLHLTSPG